MRLLGSVLYGRPAPRYHDRILGDVNHLPREAENVFISYPTVPNIIGFGDMSLKE